MPEDWLADDGLDPAVFESGNHAAMWREIARFEAVLLARLQDWAARNAKPESRAILPERTTQERTTAPEQRVGSCDRWTARSA